MDMLWSRRLLDGLTDKPTTPPRKMKGAGVCKGGVATMLLSPRRISAVTIEGGIRDWPYEKAVGMP